MQYDGNNYYVQSLFVFFLCDMLEVLEIEKKDHVVRIAIAQWEYFSIRIWSNKGSLHIKQL